MKLLNKKILVVDDDVDITSALKVGLEQMVLQLLLTMILN